jgi:alpha-1,3-mannosyltransferase
MHPARACCALRLRPRCAPPAAAFAHWRWLARDGGLGGAVRNAWARLRGRCPPLRALSAEHVASVMFEGNLLGIVAARSLHFQFYSWCAHARVAHARAQRRAAAALRCAESAASAAPGPLTRAAARAPRVPRPRRRRYCFSLPYLVWRAALPTPARLALLAAVEACWNVYPPTRGASVLLAACHLLLLAGLAAARREPAPGRARAPPPQAGQLQSPRTRSRALKHA